MSNWEIGSKLESRSFGPFTVIDYINANNAVITFDNTGYTYSVSASNARKGWAV